MVSEMLRLAALDAVSAPIVLAIAEHDEDAPGVRVGHANPAFAALMGTHDPIVAGARLELFAPDTSNEPNLRLRRAICERRATIVLGVARRADGSEFRLEARVAPLDADDEGPATAVVSLRALTAPTGRPLQADLALAALDAASDELAWVYAALLLTLDAFPGVALIIDPQGAMRAAGGAGRGDIGLACAPEGQTLAQVLGEAAAHVLEPHIAAATEQGRVRFDFTFADRVFDAVAAPVRLDTGRSESVAVFLHDITDERAALAALAPHTPWGDILRDDGARDGEAPPAG